MVETRSVSISAKASDTLICKVNLIASADKFLNILALGTMGGVDEDVLIVCDPVYIFFFFT